MQVRLFEGTYGTVDRDELEHARHLLRGDACECEAKSYNGKLPFQPEQGPFLLVWPEDVEAEERRYWISTNPDEPTFETPEAAIGAWMASGADTIPSCVRWTEGDENGTVGVAADDWQNGPYRLVL